MSRMALIWEGPKVQTISRRMFLLLGGCALVTPSISLSVEVPSLLDHILLGCSDLGRGIEFVSKR